MNQIDWNPGRLLETSGGFWLSCALHGGVKLEIFTAIGDGAFSVTQIAKSTSCDKRGLTMLLNALTAMNLLEKRDEKFSNSPFSKTFLSKNSSKYLGHIIMHHHHLVESWSRLDKAVKTGNPVRTRASLKSKIVRESFLMGMFNMGMNLAPQVAAKVDLSKMANLLDLGGGPGTFAIHFCLKNPKLRATVFDLPTTKPFAEKTIKKFDLENRIDFQPGNFLEDKIAGKFDVAWLSHILHGEDFNGCQTVLQKAVTALKPGGTIMIHEFILNDSMDGPLFPAIFSLNMLLGTPGGQSYSESQLKEMLKKAGIKKIERLDFRGPNDSGIVAGFK